MSMFRHRTFMTNHSALVPTTESSGLLIPTRPCHFGFRRGNLGRRDLRVQPWIATPQTLPAMTVPLSAIRTFVGWCKPARAARHKNGLRSYPASQACPPSHLYANLQTFA